MVFSLRPMSPSGSFFLFFFFDILENIMRLLSLLLSQTKRWKPQSLSGDLLCLDVVDGSLRSGSWVRNGGGQTSCAFASSLWSDVLYAAVKEDSVGPTARGPGVRCCPYWTGLSKTRFQLFFSLAVPAWEVTPHLGVGGASVFSSVKQSTGRGDR